MSSWVHFWENEGLRRAESYSQPLSFLTKSVFVAPLVALELHFGPPSGRVLCLFPAVGGGFARGCYDKEAKTHPQCVLSTCRASVLLRSTVKLFGICGVDILGGTYKPTFLAVCTVLGVVYSLNTDCWPLAWVHY